MPCRPIASLIEGGQKQSPSREVGGPIGTQFEVRDLFYNVPARLKFMKSESTESSHIAETLLRLALAFPACTFGCARRARSASICRRKERTRTLTRSAGRPRQSRRPADAVRGSRGGEWHGRRGHVGAPATARPCRATSFCWSIAALSATARCCTPRCRAMASSGKGRYPLLVLHVTLDPATVDVNVHPQKLEVRLSQADAVYSLVREATRGVAAKAPWLRGAGGRVGHPARPAVGAERVYTVGATTPVLGSPPCLWPLARQCLGEQRRQPTGQPAATQRRTSAAAYGLCPVERTRGTSGPPAPNHGPVRPRGRGRRKDRPGPAVAKGRRHRRRRVRGRQRGSSRPTALGNRSLAAAPAVAGSSLPRLDQPPASAP